MEINEKDIRLVPLEDELKKPKGKRGQADAKMDSAKPASKESVDNVRVDAYKERRWLVIMGALVFILFMVTFLSILAVQLAKFGDVDKTL